MAEKAQEVYFVSIDEASNRSRGYSLSLLKSGKNFSVRKRWGRVEKVQDNWQLRHHWYEKYEIFNHYEEALTFMEKVNLKRQKNGYVVVETIKEGEGKFIQLKLPF